MEIERPFVSSVESKFRAWKRKVDAVLTRTCGLSSSDLADQPYRDWFDDGVTPAQAAKMVLEEEGFPS